MASQKIVEYVKKSLAAGAGQQDVMNALKKSGWRDGDISDAFKAVNEKSRVTKQGQYKPPSMPARPTKHAKPKSGKTRPAMGGSSPAGSSKHAKPKSGPSQPIKSSLKPSKPARPRPKDANETGKKKKHGFLGLFKRGKSKDDASGKKAEKAKKPKKEAAGRKEKAVPIVYKKPQGKLTTEVDDMLEIISQKKKIRVNKLAKVMNVKSSEIKEWMETLENWGIIEVHYPLFGEPVLTMAKKKIKKSDEKES